MRLKVSPLFVLLACLAATLARAAHTEAQLLLSADTAKPGETVWAGVELKMEPGWHTYWKNPGEAGQATEIKWALPPGIAAGETEWPLPRTIPPADVTTYGYENEVVLLVPLTLASNLPAGPLAIVAKVSWLECKESCIPANQEVEAKLNIGSRTIISAAAAAIQAWKQKVPQPAPEFHAQGYWEKPAADGARRLKIKFAFSPRPDAVDFYPDASGDYQVQTDTGWGTGAEAGWLWLDTSIKKYSGSWPAEISGVIGVEVDGQRQGFETKVPIVAEDALPAAGPGISGQNPAVNVLPAQPLWQMLLFAFIGGLILNIMPCVLPVIALKILGFVSEARSEPRRVRRLGLVYALGVLFSFLALAAVVIGVKAAGHQAGWGMQFGSPVFVVCLTTLVMLVALNLFGVFEVTLGGKTLDTANELAPKHGAAGAFFNGVLATTLATPCTAPFLAPALGFAFSQNAATIIFIFLTVGLGLAAPYVLLSWQPAWLKFLPKPGAWMEKFKVAMGFPMLATVVWLLHVAAGDYGRGVFWLGIFLVIVAAAAWVFGEFFQRGQKRRGLALAGTLVLLSGGYVFALEKNLGWRAPVAQADATAPLKESADGIDWLPWSPAAVAQARDAGKIVLVDFTADWCLTCQVNKKTSLETSSVREKIKSLGVVALLGNYTHFPPAITAELNKFGRAGVPLVLVYPKDRAAGAVALPEVLTPGTVLDALAKAAQ